MTWTLLSGAAVAQTTLGGIGADLVPAASTEARVLSHEVTYAHAPLTGWRVSQHTRWRNPTGAPLALALDFTETPCDPTLDCGPRGGRFDDVITLVDGVLVEAAITGPTRRLTVPLAAGAEVEVRHSYAMDMSSGVDFWTLRHRLAGGPVSLTVRMPRPVWYVTWPDALTLETFAIEADPAGGSHTRLRFAAGDAPRGELVLGFPGQALSASTPAGMCTGWEGDQQEAAVIAELERWSSERLTACRDHLLALYGATPSARYGTNPFPLPPGATRSAYRPASDAVDRTWLSGPEQAWLHQVEAALAR